MKPELIVLRGLPGAGKSTFASRMLSPDIARIEADQYRSLSGKYVYSREENELAHQWVAGKVIDLLKRGKYVVVTGTYIKPKHVVPLYNIADALGCGFRVFDILGQYESVHNVSPEVMQKMSDEWEELPVGMRYVEPKED